MIHKFLEYLKTNDHEIYLLFFPNTSEEGSYLFFLTCDWKIIPYFEDHGQVFLEETETEVIVTTSDDGELSFDKTMVGRYYWIFDQGLTLGNFNSLVEDEDIRDVLKYI